MSFVNEAIQFCIDCTRRNIKNLTSFPERAENGQWLCVDNGGWVGGHWTGILWLSYAHAKDNDLQAAARQWTARLAPRAEDTTTHDLGFLFELSHILGYKVTGDVSFKAPAIFSTQTLTRRFNTKGRFFQAWGPLDADAARRGRAIIDTMMNLDLLYWTSKQTGDPRFAQMATDHALTVLQRHVRLDWSTSHVTDFNPDTGEFLKQDTHQGFSATSCWSRGHSWAVYGFAECYRETGIPIFLHASKSLAEYCLQRLPADSVPFWDYDSPLIPNDVRDSSAASILASSLLNLAALDSDPAVQARYKARALIILENLWKSYTSRGTGEQSILIHATRSKPQLMMDHGLIYGDYYFLEALTRLQNPGIDL